jgi:PAS domain S-box-containing protein
VLPFQQYKCDFERTNDSIITRNIDGVITFWNHAAEKLYGWKKEEAKGRVSHALLQTEFPKPLQEIESELVRTGGWEGKLVHKMRDGRRVVVDSRWIFQPEAPSEPVLEINTPATDCELHSQARLHNHSVANERENPLSAGKMKAEEIPTKIANIVVASGGFLCLLAFFYFTYYYGWNVKRDFSHPVDLVLYWVFPAVLTTLLFGFLRWSPESKVKAAIVCVSVAVSVGLLELLLAVSDLRLFGPAPTLWGPTELEGRDKEDIVALAKRTGIDFDRRRKVEVVMDLRNQGISAVPNIVPLELLSEQQDGGLKSAINIDGVEVLPVGGISNRAAVLCNETGEYSIYKADEHGFHNPRGIWKSRRVAIAALGDSFAEGSCVTSDKNFVALIRGRYPATLNLGKSGNGPMITLAALEEYLPWKQPEAVLWFHFEGNELEDLLEERKSPLLRDYLRDGFSQRLLDRQNEIDNALSGYVESALRKELAHDIHREKQPLWATDTVTDFLKLRHLRQLLKISFGRTERTSGDNKYSESQLDLFRRVLSRAKESVNGWGGELYFVYLPARDRYARGYDYSRNAVLNIVKDIGLIVIDLEPAFRLQGDPFTLFPFGRFGHYNEQGHRLIADKVLGVLNRQPSHTIE